eukprot:14676141-Ditylum_brightwellii.AAC.1
MSHKPNSELLACLVCHGGFSEASKVVLLWQDHLKELGILKITKKYKKRQWTKQKKKANSMAKDTKEKYKELKISINEANKKDEEALEERK